MTNFWKEYMIAGVITTFGYFLIYARQNSGKFDFSVWFFGLPFVWAGLLIMTIPFILLLSEKESEKKCR